MKIAHVITGLEPGGAETVLCRLLETLPRRDFDHTVVALLGEDALTGRVRATGFPIVHLNLNPARPNPGLLLTLRRLIRADAPAVVQSWMYHANLAAALATTGLRLPLVWGVRHALNDWRAETRSARAIIRLGALFSWSADAVVYNAVSSARQHEGLGFRAARTRVIANGVDLAEFHPDPSARAAVRAELGIADDALVIGLVARFHPMKDQETFLRAAAEYLKASGAATFVLVGAEVTRENSGLMRLVTDLRLAGHVRLLGDRSDVPRLMPAMDIATCSSWTEAFPNVVVEAMACGVPCVTTAVGDAPAIVGDTGRIVPARDPVAMSVGWAALSAAGPARRRALGEQARARVAEHFRLEKMTGEFASLWRQIGRG